MTEYINRDDLLKAAWDKPTLSLGVYDIGNIKTVDVAPVRHGQWEYYDTYIDGITIFRCTCCGDLQSGRDGWGWKKNYCPNCGAKMDSDRL